MIGARSADLVQDDPVWIVGLITVGAAFRAAFHVRVEGGRHLPRTGGAIVALNHVSVLDSIGIAVACSDRGRTVRFLAASEAFDVPLVGWGLRVFRQIPIRRGARDVAALERAAEVVRAGALAGIYPEGRVGETGVLQPGRTGVGRLSLASGAPVVPVGVWGAQARWPQGGPKLRGPLRPPFAVVFGEPIHPGGELTSQDDVRALTDRVMSSIGKLVERAKVLSR